MVLKTSLLLMTDVAALATLSTLVPSIRTGRMPVDANIARLVVIRVLVVGIFVLSFDNCCCSRL